MNAKEVAKKLLQENIDKVDKVVKVLLEKRKKSTEKSLER